MELQPRSRFHGDVSQKFWLKPLCWRGAFLLAKNFDATLAEELTRHTSA